MSDDQVSQWKKFADQARSGELYLNDEATARECLAACDKRIQDLSNMTNLIGQTQNVSGFGDFEMGHALEGVFLKQSTGEPNSIDQVINDNIEVVKNIREVMVQSIKILTGQDVDNAAQVNAVDPGGAH